MARFVMNLEQAKGCEEALEKCMSQINRYAGWVEEICDSFRGLGIADADIRAALRDISEEIKSKQKNMREQYEALRRILTIYERTENGICEMAESSFVAYAPIGREWDGEPVQEDGCEGGNDAYSYVADAFQQMFMGDFTEKSNSLGIALKAMAGCIPVVGQIADVRDLTADIICLVDGGPSFEECLTLGLTFVGLKPAVENVFKRGDDIGNAVKAMLGHTKKAEHTADFVKRTLYKGDEACSAVGAKVEEFHAFFRQTVTDRIDGFIEGHPAGRQIREGFADAVGAVKGSGAFQDADRILSRLTFSKGNWELSAKAAMQGIAEQYRDEIAQSAVVELFAMISEASKDHLLL